LCNKSIQHWLSNSELFRKDIQNTRDFFKHSPINNCKISKGQTFDVKKFICQFYSPCFCFYSSLERGPAEKTNIDPKYILLKEITTFGNRSCEVMSSPFWLFKNFSTVLFIKLYLLITHKILIFYKNLYTSTW